MQTLNWMIPVRADLTEPALVPAHTPNIFPIRATLNLRYFWSRGRTRSRRWQSTGRPRARGHSRACGRRRAGLGHQIARRCHCSAGGSSAQSAPAQPLMSHASVSQLSIPNVHIIVLESCTAATALVETTAALEMKTRSSCSIC